MSYPEELDVPHWAMERVRTIRSGLKICEDVTDRMIFAAIVSHRPNKTVSSLEALKRVSELPARVTAWKRRQTP